MGRQLRKIRLFRMTESLTPAAREMVQRLLCEPVRVEQNTGGIDVIRSSTPLPADLISWQDTEVLQTVTPSEWLTLRSATVPKLSDEEGWLI